MRRDARAARACTESPGWGQVESSYAARRGVAPDEREMVMAGDVQVIANAKKSARKLKGMHKLKEVSACCLSCAVLTLGAWVGASGRKRVTVPAAA